MTGELNFNRGFHVEVTMVRAKRSSLYFVHGPGDVVLEATSELSRARKAIQAFRFPNLCHIREQRDSGVIVATRFERRVSDFILADLISKPFIT